MTSKPMAFQPAPRPHPHASPQQARDLAEATRELGFGRTTTAPKATPVADATVPTPPAAPETTQPVKPRAQVKPANAAAPTDVPELGKERMASLKVEMPDDIWNALRHEALNRRVTVKYLVLEALAAKGYGIDLTKVAEDGRRVR